ncbi:MAG: hypothetical protein OK449_08425 [Thaumarchaeota archaeon]|nr:hypothetical protein [Nitrososphaerota archaeon]
MGEFARVPRIIRHDRLVAGVFLAAGAAAAILAAYYYATFLGLENPLTHTLPSSTSYFSYVQNYYQTEADYQVCWKLSVVALGVSAFSFAFRSVKDLPVFGPFHKAHALLRSRSQRLKTMVLVVPLVLLETGLFLYGGLMGVARLDFPLSLEIRGQPLVRALVIGPLGPSGGPYGSGQDYYFLALFVGVLAASFYRYESVRRVLQIGALSIIPLPALIYLFDGVEFNTFFAAAVDRMGLPWFSNAVLLYLSVVVFALATAYPALMRLAYRATRRAHAPGL